MTEYEILFDKVKKNKDIELEEIDKTEIEDISKIKINKNIPAQERIIEFLRKTKNPYVFKVNDTMVKITFGMEDVDIMQCLCNIVKNSL